MRKISQQDDIHRLFENFEGKWQTINMNEEKNFCIGNSLIRRELF